MMMPLNLSGVNTTSTPLLFLIYRESSKGGSYLISRAYKTCSACSIFKSTAVVGKSEGEFKAGGLKQKLR